MLEQKQKDIINPEYEQKLEIQIIKTKKFLNCVPLRVMGAKKP